MFADNPQSINIVPTRATSAAFLSEYGRGEWRAQPERLSTTTTAGSVYCE
jgi:hypothetical protein